MRQAKCFFFLSGNFHWAPPSCVAILPRRQQQAARYYHRAHSTPNILCNTGIDGSYGPWWRAAPRAGARCSQPSGPPTQGCLSACVIAGRRRTRSPPSCSVGPVLTEIRWPCGLSLLAGKAYVPTRKNASEQTPPRWLFPPVVPLHISPNQEPVYVCTYYSRGGSAAYVLSRAPICMTYHHSVERGLGCCSFDT